MRGGPVRAPFCRSRCVPVPRAPGARQARRALQGIESLSLVPSPSAALEDADALLVVTEWKEFRNPDFDAIRTTLRQPVIFDGLNLYDPAHLRRLGIEYHSVGRPPA